MAEDSTIQLEQQIKQINIIGIGGTGGNVIIDNRYLFYELSKKYANVIITDTSNQLDSFEEILNHERLIGTANEGIKIMPAISDLIYGVSQNISLGLRHFRTGWFGQTAPFRTLTQKVAYANLWQIITSIGGGTGTTFTIGFLLQYAHDIYLREVEGSEDTGYRATYPIVVHGVMPLFSPGLEVGGKIRAIWFLDHYFKIREKIARVFYNLSPVQLILYDNEYFYRKYNDFRKSNFAIAKSILAITKAFETVMLDKVYPRFHDAREFTRIKGPFIATTRDVDYARLNDYIAGKIRNEDFYSDSMIITNLLKAIEGNRSYRRLAYNNIMLSLATYLDMATFRGEKTKYREIDIDNIFVLGTIARNYLTPFMLAKDKLGGIYNLLYEFFRENFRQIGSFGGHIKASERYNTLLFLMNFPKDYGRYIFRQLLEEVENIGERILESGLVEIDIDESVEKGDRIYYRELKTVQENKEYIDDAVANIRKHLNID